MKMRYLKAEAKKGAKQFEENSDITYLAKKIDIIEEKIVKMHEWQDEFD